MPDIDLGLAQQCAQALPGWLYALLLPLLAPHLDAWIKQPAAGSIWRLIRLPLSLLAGNYGWAKNAYQESLAEWWAANRQALAVWLIKLAGDALKAELAKQAAAPVEKVEQPPADDPHPAEAPPAPVAAAPPPGA